VLPEIKAIVANTNVRFFIIDSPEKEEQLRPSVAEGLIKSSIVAVGPKGPSEQWIRQKAGFGRHDDAARAREQSFREYLTDLADGPVSKDQTLTITLARTEYLEIAAAKPGKELIRATPSAVMNLLLLLGEEGGLPLPGEQVELIQEAIGKNRSDIAVLCSIRPAAGAGAKEDPEGSGEGCYLQAQSGCLPTVPSQHWAARAAASGVKENSLTVVGGAAQRATSRALRNGYRIPGSRKAP
jgi:hypothetical protein